MMRSLILMFLVGCGRDLPVFYTSIGQPVFVKSANVPLLEDINNTIENHLVLAQEFWGQDMRAKYIHFLYENDNHAILFTDNQEDLSSNRASGQFDSRSGITILFDAPGCMATYSLPHEMIHFGQYVLDKGYADYEHDDPGMWNGPDSFQMRARAMGGPSVRNSNKPPLQNWATPQWLFDWFDARFHFTVDVCAEKHNAKCSKYWTKEDDGLRQRLWCGETVWCNPPYADILPWVQQTFVYHVDCAGSPRGVLLLPARTDRPWFQACLTMHEIWFLAGRYKFDPPPGFVENGGKVTSGGFPLIAVIFGLAVTPKTRFVDPRNEKA